MTERRAARGGAPREQQPRERHHPTARSCTGRRSLHVRGRSDVQRDGPIARRSPAQSSAERTLRDSVYLYSAPYRRRGAVNCIRAHETPFRRSSESRLPFASALSRQQETSTPKKLLSWVNNRTRLRRIDRAS